MINQSQLLQHIKAHPGRTRKELAENFNTIIWNIESPLQSLLMSGAIYRKMMRGHMTQGNAARYYATPDKRAA